MDFYLGQIILFAGNYAPANWAFCNGQLLPISQYSALYSVLGVTYGGDGQTTFALPNLSGRVAVGAGNGPGLSPYAVGDQMGQEQVTLNSNQMPTHSHTVNANGGEASSTSPVGNLPAPAESAGYAPNANATMSQQMIAPSGGNQPHENRQPLLALNYLICVNGLYPARP